MMVLQGAGATSMQRVRLARVDAETRDIRSFELVAVDGGALAPFSAGAHLDVHLGNGLVRQYSLCNDPAETNRYLLGVLLDPASRGGSAAMHALRAGQELQVSAPRNHFPLAAQGQRHLLLAGGIGATPLLAMAEQLARDAAPFEFHYCTRSADRTAFAQRLREAPWAGRLHLHHDDGPAAQRLDLAAILARHEPGVHLYVCGPAGFIDAVLSAARASGWPEEALHREFFAAPSAVAAQGGDGTFEVQIASTGAVVGVAADQSVVAALAAAGIRVPVSCEQGVCGTCLTRVIDGRPDHRDLYLTDAERDAGNCFTPCCSRSLSPRLVLDL